MDSTNFAKEHKDAYEAIKTKHARIYTIPSKINNETWFNTLLHWMAPEGRMPTSYRLGHLDRLRKKVKSSPIKNCRLGMTIITEKIGRASPKLKLFLTQVP